MSLPQCGTKAAYRYYGCRCEDCREWHRNDVGSWRNRKRDAEAAIKMARREATVAAIRAAMAQKPLPTPKSPHAPPIASEPQTLAQGQRLLAAVGKGFKVSLTDEDCLGQRRG